MGAPEMNEHERKMLDKIAEQNQRIDDYLMKPPGPGRKTRAQELDELLAAKRAGSLAARAVLWLLGFIAAVGAAVTYVKSGLNGLWR